VSEGGNPGPYPIEPERLRVFPTEGDLPKDQLNTTIDQHFVPVASVAPAEPGQFDTWKAGLLAELRRVCFRHFPEAIPAARLLDGGSSRIQRMESEDGIQFHLRFRGERREGEPAANVLLVVLNPDEAGGTPDWIAQLERPDQTVVLCEPRGVGATRWTTKNPPNYVERSHVLVGRTVDTGRVWDVIAAAGTLRAEGSERQVQVAGRGAAGIIAAYAAALDDGIAGATVIQPVTTHAESDAPLILNVLRVCDVPDVLGLIAPRRLTLIGAPAGAFPSTRQAYRAAGADSELSLIE
jgi:hypothetical protein